LSTRRASGAAAEGDEFHGTIVMTKFMSRAGVGAPERKPAVIALHCSGSTGRQWSKLALALGDRFTRIAPDLVGSGATPHWNGARFCLADEAARINAIIDGCKGDVHLAGHSYGGAVALRVAIEQPARIASLSLYEPTAFHVLRDSAVSGRAALSEIRSIAGRVAHDVTVEDYAAAGRRFVDYWNGAGTWAAIKPESQAELIRYVPKATLEFSALIDEPTPLTAYRGLACPALLIWGERTRAPAALITQKLFSIMRNATIEEIPGAGHMGPFSHADRVAETIAAHVAAAAGVQWPADQKSVARLGTAA
jgi:pimeloyl-ACP methyl ester carboxylesterase